MSNYRTQIKGGKTRAAIALIYRLAALMRASFIYPLNNQRVVEARDEFLRHGQAWVNGGTVLSISHADGKVMFGGAPVTTPPQLAGWIAECFEQAFLTGIKIAPDIDEAAIAEFAATLRRCKTEAEADSKSLWNGEYFGLVPLTTEIEEVETEAESSTARRRQTDIPAAGPDRNWAEPGVPIDVAEIAPQGSAQQDNEIDQLAEKIGHLPFSTMLGLATEDARQESELFGIYLHRYLQESNEDTAQRLGKRVIAMLESPSPGMMKILKTYLQPAPPEGIQDGDSKRSIVEFLQHHGRADLLRKNESLRPDVVAFSFPDNFTLFLDSLSATRSLDMKALRDVCFAINKERLIKATEMLIGDDGILTPERVNLITAAGTYELMDLVSIIATHGPSWSRAAVAQFLRKQEFPAAEAAALRAINPPSLLPAGYLRDLCELHSMFQGNAKLRDFSGFLVRRFIEDSANHVEQAERRIYAIRSLRNLPCLESIKMLKKLSSPSRLLSLNKTARAERQVALETLHEMVGD